MYIIYNGARVMGYSVNMMYIYVWGLSAGGVRRMPGGAPHKSYTSPGTSPRLEDEGGMLRARVGKLTPSHP
jgi:hypothetical protein